MKGVIQIVILIITSGMLFAQPGNDDFADAYDVTSLIGSCSSNEAYTTVGASDDESAGSCFDTHAYNVWFKFDATSTEEITVTVDRGSLKGDIEKVNIAIWSYNGSTLTQIACEKYASNTADVSVFADGLTDGDTYYISVDNQTSAKRGTFTLCLDEGAGSSATNDEIADAVDVTSLIGTCSADQAYDNTGATADGSAGSCFNTHAYNVWFKFTAPTSGNIDITIDIGGSKGTMQRVNLALWESDASTEVACAIYSANGDDVSIIQSGLTPGDTYYFSVDNKTPSAKGTFSICMDDLDIFYSITDGNWNTASTWSHDGHSGTATSLVPSSGCIVHVQGHDLTVNSSGICDSLLVNVDDAQTSLTLNDNLTVESNVWMVNSGNNYDAYIKVQNGASLTTNDFNIERNGGANVFKVDVLTGSYVNISNLNLTSSSGSTEETEFNLDGSGSLTVSNDVTFNYTGGTKLKVFADKTAVISVSDDIIFNNSAKDAGEIELNSTSTLKIGGDFTRTSSFGILDMNSSSNLEFIGTAAQILPTIYGAGGDAFSYQNVKINNTYGTSPQITTDGAVFIYGDLDLTDGIVQTTSVNKIYMMDNATTSNASSVSYVEGPITKVGNDSFDFPVGLNGDYAPIGMTAPSTTGNYFTAQYYQDNPGSIYDASSKDANIESLSATEYWTLDRDIGSSSVAVTLSRSSGRSDSLSTINNYLVCRWDGSTWQDHGNSANSGDYSNGTVTSGSVSSFSPFAFGKTSVPVILPVELLSFSASLEEQAVSLDWVTASENNNNFFEIQRSTSKGDWEVIGEVLGFGTTTEMKDYTFADMSPLSGIAYYRLRQVDFNGQFEYTNIVSVNSKSALMAIDFSVYPNPCNNKVIVKGLGERDIIRVFNSLGQEIHIQSTFNSIDEQMIDLSGLPIGTYMIYANGSTQTFVKQ